MPLDPAIPDTGQYLLLPDLILTPDGPVRAQALAVDTRAIAAIGGAADLKQCYSDWSEHLQLACAPAA